MTFCCFLENLQNFFKTGKVDLPGRSLECPEDASRAVVACSLFEREVYKRLGTISSSSYSRFYGCFLDYLVQGSPLLFSALDSQSKDILQRNLDSAAEYFPDRITDISRISRLVL